ncbi:kunitz-type serine protease inhibitor A-like [Pituophis catenifer annectens]|uniref:kunitz-type serine protease inhibitor A-like n=1 Tax=Pituophis catenifer annectens TaxID=94852 RepID=UPI0039929B99
MHAWGSICLLLILQFVTSGQLPHKCKLSPKEGKCKKALERVYYDHKKKICLNFVYGGCGGNKNNFATLQDCLYQCKKFDLELPTENTAGNIDWKKLTSRRCRLYPKKGWCKKHSTRYYYDFKLHRCRAFTYHGCGGNENNFSNYIDCVKACDVFGTPDQSFAISRAAPEARSKYPMRRIQLPALSLTPLV